MSETQPVDLATQFRRILSINKDQRSSTVSLYEQHISLYEHLISLYEHLISL